MYSRRNFLKTSTAAAASLLPSSTLRASIATLAGSLDQPDNIAHARRLSEGWEFLQGSLGGPWEAWHSEEVAVWQPVTMFDITDLVIPDLLPQPAQEATPPTETATSAAKNKKKQRDGVPISVLCDNSRELDRMSSDLSDFSLYGGMYRHVNLVYVPAVSLETVHVRTEFPSTKGPAKIAIVGTLYDPADATDSFEVSVEVTDAKGTSIHRSKQMFKPWHG